MLIGRTADFKYEYADFDFPMAGMILDFKVLDTVLHHVWEPGGKADTSDKYCISISNSRRQLVGKEDSLLMYP